VSVFVRADDRWQVEIMNDVQHLKTPGLDAGDGDTLKP